MSNFTSEQLSYMLFLLGAIIYYAVADTAVAYFMGIRSKKGMAIIAFTNVLTTIFLTNPCLMFLMGSAIAYVCVLPFLAAAATAAEAVVYYIFSQTIPHPVKVAVITNIVSIALLTVLLPVFCEMFGMLLTFVDLFR